MESYNKDIDIKKICVFMVVNVWAFNCIFHVRLIIRQVCFFNHTFNSVFNGFGSIVHSIGKYGSIKYVSYHTIFFRRRISWLYNQVWSFSVGVADGFVNRYRCDQSSINIIILCSNRIYYVTFWVGFYWLHFIGCVHHFLIQRLLSESLGKSLSLPCLCSR